MEIDFDIIDLIRGDSIDESSEYLQLRRELADAAPPAVLYFMKLGLSIGIIAHGLLTALAAVARKPRAADRGGS